MLINDPLVGQMNETQWLFELESLKLHEEDRLKEIKEILDVFRASMANLLGLDLMPFRDDNGNLRRASSDEYTPLALLVGRREWLKDLGEKMEELLAQEDVQSDLDNPPPGMISSLEELEEFEAEQAALESDGDIQFPDDPEDLQKFIKWNSPHAKHIRENLILPLEDEEDPEALLQEAAEGDPEAEEPQDEPVEGPAKRRLTIDDDA